MSRIRPSRSPRMCSARCQAELTEGSQARRAHSPAGSRAAREALTMRDQTLTSRSSAPRIGVVLGTGGGGLAFTTAYDIFSCPRQGACIHPSFPCGLSASFEVLGLRVCALSRRAAPADGSMRTLLSTRARATGYVITSSSMRRLRRASGRFQPDDLLTKVNASRSDRRPFSLIARNVLGEGSLLCARDVRSCHEAWRAHYEKSWLRRDVRSYIECVGIERDEPRAPCAREEDAGRSPARLIRNRHARRGAQHRLNACVKLALK